MESRKPPNIIYPITNYEETAQQIAAAIGANWEHNHYKLTPWFGEGMVEAYNYPNGSLMLSRFTTVNPVKIGRAYSGLKGHLAFDFILSGFSQYFENQVDDNITQLQYGVYISTPRTESFGWFENNVLHEHLSIVIDQTWLSNFIAQPLPSILQNSDTPLMIFVPIPSNLFHSLLALLRSNPNSPLRKPYLYSKILELMVVMIEELAGANNQYEQQPFAPEELDQLFQIATFIQQNLKTPLSIESLSEKFGINRNKMQALFKSVYGKTIAEYTRHLRMNFAYQLLANHKTVGEVGYLLGYSNLSHFSAAFKKVHGINPSEVVKERK